MDLAINSFRGTMMGIAETVQKNAILASARLVLCCRENPQIKDQLIDLFEECLREIRRTNKL